MAKKENSPAISFFSFQDIITSITGIMFLVVMMLVLLAVTRSAAPTTEEKAVQEQVGSLRKQLVALKQKIAENAMSRDDLRRRVEELKKCDLATLARRKAALFCQVEQLTSDVEQEKRDRAALEKAVSDAKREIARRQEEEKRVETENEVAAKNMQECEKEKQRLEQLLAHRSKLIRFFWQGNTSKRPLLAVCSKEEIAVQNGLDGTPLFTAKGQGGALQGQFLVWCRDQKSEDHYFVLLVKPSAFDYADDLSEQLKKLGFERGREILPTDDLDVTGSN